MGVFWLHDTLFCNQRAKDVFEENQVTGIEYLPVLHNKAGFIEGTYQLKILEQTKIEKEFRKSEFKAQQICKTCNTSFVYPSPDYLTKYDIDQFDVNAEIFYSAGPFNHRSIIISRKVYDLFMRLDLDRNLRFDVVFLRDMFDLIRKVPNLNFYESSRIYHKKLPKYLKSHNINEIYQDKFYFNIYPGEEKKWPEEIRKRIPVFISEEKAFSYK